MIQLPHNKIQVRRLGPGTWVCTRPPYGFGYCDMRYFRSWRTAMDWATAAVAGSVASADLQLASQPFDAISATPLWTPLVLH